MNARFLTRRRAAWWAVVLALSAVVLVLVSARASTASAHPLGNFTINHYDRIEVSPDQITVHQVLDMAEIPAFQERQSIDTNGDGTIDDAESEAWAKPKSDELRSHIQLTVNGEAIELADTGHELRFDPGEGGLFILRFTVTYTGAPPDDWPQHTPSVQFSDDNYPDRVGWREIIVRGAPGVDIVGSSVPAEDITRELRVYPTSYLSSPLDIRSATFSFRPGAGSAPLPTPNPDHERAVRGNPDATLTGYSDLISKDELTVPVIIVALLAALGFGAIHALSPGHGKTIVAAYLIGSRGTARDALVLGLTVTATHTSSVYALGFIAFYLSEYIVPERLYPWLGIASGAIIVLMGLALLIGRARASGIMPDALAWMRGGFRRRPPGLRVADGESGSIVMWPQHAHGSAWHEHAAVQAEALDHHHHVDIEPDHDHAEHDASAPHKHGWGPAHSHAIPGQDGEPVTWQRLIGLGVFGGLLPCPSAIVVMLSAIALHRIAFGLVLIVAFSLGLAGVLTAIGFALVYMPIISRRVPLVRRLSERAEGNSIANYAVRVFPTMAAAFVIAAGLVILLRALDQQGTI